ncbi:alpha/beta hydrolase [Phreatobacter stygius]|uniref:Alpha/beta hydrolase n=1 Tax=Phreatobacter stygius TaxID=1940610 RepID=A0A4D7B9F5_9HYPH|nr:alpha/beta hydrolase [Phreatobacter stygius]QCI67160.1 alpha/beta hydrolase [Phreatobacter stygius]
MRQRWITWCLIALVAGAAAGYAAFKLSPWPSVMLIRFAFDMDAAARNRALERHLPGKVTEWRDQRYGQSSDALFDIFLPSDADATSKPLPMIVWIHGGGFVAGNKADTVGYLRILAAGGYAVVGIGYSTAPGARYPTPVVQANEALAFLVANAGRWPIDRSRIFLAGDSAGAQIAAQLAAAIGGPGYAASIGIAPAIEPGALRGIVLFCGVYDASAIDLDGGFGWFIRTVLWSYLGTRDYAGDPRLAEFSVARHLSPRFPPAFVSVGNADPLAPQSVMMAEAIRAQGVAVDTLFFPAGHSPPLPHEYQFNLDEQAGRQALERLGTFLAGSAR